MIKTETITFNNKQFKHTYSDLGCMIECDGVQYADAVDVLDSERTYTETTIKVDTDDSGSSQSYIEPLEEAMDEKISEQADINTQQDEMIAELYETILGGES